MSGHEERHGPDPATDRHLTPDEVLLRNGLILHGLVITDTVVRIIRAGQREVRDSLDNMSTERAYMIGVQVGVNACLAAAQEHDNAATKAESAVQQPRRAPWSDVLEFAETHGYPLISGRTTRLYRRLRPQRLRDEDDELRPLVERLWHTEEEVVSGRRISVDSIDLDVALELFRGLVVERGYSKERHSTTFHGVSANTLSLMADYLNHVHGFGDDDPRRLPTVRDGASSGT